jgi:hypothetical protein
MRMHCLQNFHPFACSDVLICTANLADSKQNAPKFRLVNTNLHFPEASRLYHLRHSGVLRGGARITLSWRSVLLPET